MAINDTSGNPAIEPAGGLVFNTVSDRIAPAIITASFASYGVVAIYVTVGRVDRRAPRDGCLFWCTLPCVLDGDQRWRFTGGPGGDCVSH